MTPALSIIIVNYKTPDLVIGCLQSLGIIGLPYEVIVVDNNSNDGSRDIICAEFPAVEWIQMDYNAGFARANNAGIRYAHAPVVLLLNSDTLVADNAIEKCHKLFVQSTYVACGVQLLNPDGSPQISGNYFMTGGLNVLLTLPITGVVVKWLGTVLRIQKPNVPNASGEVPVDWINGAFLMVKKSAIDRAGLLDEDFFLYAEEAEWCSRLRKYGQLCIYGQFNVVHLQGETANKTFGTGDKGYYNLYDRKGLQIMLSNFVRIRKQFGTGWFLFNLSLFTAEIPIFFIASFLINLFRLRAPWRDFPRAAQFARNVGRIWGYAPKIIANRPYFYKVL